MRDTERGRIRLPQGSPMQDLIPGPQAHTLRQRQMLNHLTTQVSPKHFFKESINAQRQTPEVNAQLCPQALL